MSFRGGIVSVANHFLTGLAYVIISLLISVGLTVLLIVAEIIAAGNIVLAFSVGLIFFIISVTVTGYLVDKIGGRKSFRIRG